MNEITDPQIGEALDQNWAQIAIFAYENFLNFGRGAVALEPGPQKDKNDVSMRYVTYPKSHSSPDVNLASLLANYDPDWELLIHYVDSVGDVHTTRLRAQSDETRPEQVWFRHAFASKKRNEKGG